MHHHDGDQPGAPIAPPVADREYGPGQEAQCIPNGRSVPMMNAFTWIADAWWLFKQNPVMWIGFMLLYAAVPTILSYIPYAVVIRIPVQTLLVAGVVYSCDAFLRGRACAFGDFFAGFTRRTCPLVIVGLINFGFMVMLGSIPHRLLGSGAIHEMSADPRSLFAHISSLTATGITPEMICAGVLFIAGMVICAMAFWFAPALVMLHGMSSVKAIRMSFFAWLKNILPGIILFLVTIMLIAVSMIQFFFVLNLLATILTYFMLICTYTSYRDIFFDQEN